MRKVFGTIVRGLAWVAFAAVIAQFFLAGLGIFGATSFGAHKIVGYLIELTALLLLLLSFAAGVGRARIGQAAIFFLLAFIQPLLPSGTPWVAALHPLNAVAILFVAQQLAWPRPLRAARSATIDAVLAVPADALRGERVA